MARWDDDLRELNVRPPMDIRDHASLWGDEHISRRILELHLDPDTDEASRQPRDVERSVRWIASRLPEGAHILDVGCGPGLYAHQLASLGMSVVGIDINRASIQYATRRAREEELSIGYRHEDMLRMDFTEEFDAVLMVYGMLGSMSHRSRNDLLGRVYRALRPGGSFIFDVMTQRNLKDRSFDRDWYFSPGGFWSPDPHFVLQRAFEYEEGAFLFRTVVLEQGGRVSVHDIWDQAFTPRSLSELLTSHGFEIIDLRSDLTGSPYHEGASWLGMVCRKPGKAMG